MRIIKILFYSFKNTKNFYTSIFGIGLKNNILKNKDSELNKNNWTFGKLIRLFSDLFLIKLPITPPSWFPKFLKPIIFGQNSRYVANSQEIDQDGNCFIYINGILANEKLVMQNRMKLEKLLGRPINVIHNESHSLLMDLLEALIGKETEDLTEASTITLYTICRKLLDENIKKVIIISYSQGTIIAAKLISSLDKLGLNKKIYLEKLEIYCFATCASKMCYIIEELPYMEHFANENDFVAKLGCNRPIELKDDICIDGKIFIRVNKSGHMFNSHYINDFSNDFSLSKLNKFINN